MIIITGSGRSGTSAVARMVHESGLPVGHDLVAADEGNAAGYYEERELINRNQWILNDAGLNRWFATATREEMLAAARPHHDAMRELLANATPAWKDPRFCWTLEAWMELMPEKPRLVVCLRSPTEVVASAMKYYGQVTYEARRALEHVWLRHYDRLLEVIDGYALEAVCIEFAQLHRRPSRGIAVLERFLGRRLDAGAVRHDLRHHAGRVPPRMREMYEGVKALGEPWRVRRERPPAGARSASVPSRR